MAPKSLSEFAPAKVNLYLHVTGKRPDGYHLLDSLMVFAGVGDQITVTDGEGLSLEIEGPESHGLTADDDNLVLRAARRLAESAAIAPKAKLTLTKRLPVASGIGGGSADAAATLRLLRRFWQVDIRDDRLADLALELGADVPVCLAGRASFVAGIGERLTPAPVLPEAWMVLANPGVAVSTPSVFKARNGGFSRPAPFDTAPQTAGELAQLLAARRNDLWPAAQAIAPAIQPAINALTGLKRSLLARMSGSGATCFALFSTQSGAEAGADRLRTDHPDWWVAAAPLLQKLPEGEEGLDSGDISH